jgi:hypothetical protein
MTATASRSGPRRFERALPAVTYAVVALFAVAGAVFVVRGRLNADEGWYLDASRLVFHGQIPFRDFGFTQMPLSPYVYGLPQLLGPSIVLGRLTSLLFAVAAVGLAVRVTWRAVGRYAALAVAVLCLAFPTGIYNLTLVKTYALSAFLLVAVLAALTSPAPPKRALPWAVAAAVALTLTRTTGIVLTILVVAWAFVHAPEARRRVLGVAAAGVAIGGAFVLTDPASARYGLVTFHGLLWHGADIGTRLDVIVTDRIPDWLGEYPGYFVAIALAMLAIATLPAVRESLRRQPAPVIVLLGIAGGLVSQLLAGQWAPVEYFTPNVPALLASLAMILGPAWATLPAARRRLGGVMAAVGVAALALSTTFHPSAREYYASPDDPDAVAAAEDLGDFVRGHVSPGDPVLALWAQPVQLESGRGNVDGVSVGLFSYEDVSTTRARDVHFVNKRLLADLLEDSVPAAVVLTDVDRAFLNLRGTLSVRRSDPTRILAALERNYRPVHRSEGLGVNGTSPFDVYMRREGASVTAPQRAVGDGSPDPVSTR